MSEKAQQQQQQQQQKKQELPASPLACPASMDRDVEKASSEPHSSPRSSQDTLDTRYDAGTHELSPVPSRTANALTTTISRTLSKVRTSDTLDPGPPPDGGYQAWMMACLTHGVIFVTWGFINSYGIFQTYYVNNMHIGEESSVAWIGSIQIFIVFFMGAFVGRAVDGGYFKLVFCVGSVIFLLGMFMLSLSTTYWQILLTQGVCVGLGFGCIFVPSMALTSTYFLNRRSTALGIAVTGSATGGLVFPAIAERMLPTAGFPWTVRTMAFVQLIIVTICAAFMKPRLPPRKSGPLVEWSAFKESPYTLYLTGAYFFFWAVYTGFYYIGSFGRTILGTSQSTSINLLLVMNGVGFFGRIIPNTLAEKTGPLNMLIPIVASVGIISFAWIAVDSVSGLWAFSVVYGIFAAGIQGLFPVVLTSLTSDPKKLGTRTGMGFAMVSFAVLTGPPLAGALIQRMNGSYLGLQLFSGCCMIISTIFMVLARGARVGFGLERKI